MSKRVSFGWALGAQSISAAWVHGGDYAICRELPWKNTGSKLEKELVIVEEFHVFR